MISPVRKKINPRLRPYKRRFIVKLRDDVNIPAGAHLAELLAKHKWLPWNQLLEIDPAVQVRHLFSSLAKQQLEHLVSSAKERDPSYEPVSLFNYLSVIPSSDETFDACFRIAEEWHGDVEKVYVDLPPTAPPANNPVLNTYFEKQTYHKETPRGIDSIAAWRYPGGDGSRARFIDIEQGWTTSYPDLKSVNLQPISGVNLDYQQHGCYVLGVVLATNNTAGIVGIAWGTQAPGIVSEWSDAETYSTANAIAVAMIAITSAAAAAGSVAGCVIRRLKPRPLVPAGFSGPVHATNHYHTEVSPTQKW